jgi:hypothetical protein
MMAHLVSLMTHLNRFFFKELLKSIKKINQPVKKINLLKFEQIPNKLTQTINLKLIKKF